MGTDQKKIAKTIPDQPDRHKDLLEKIEKGLKTSHRKLVIETAAKNQSLVIKVNGEIKLVPAKELLEGLEN